MFFTDETLNQNLCVSFCPQGNASNMRPATGLPWRWRWDDYSRTPNAKPRRTGGQFPKHNNPLNLRANDKPVEVGHISSCPFSDRQDLATECPYPRPRQC